MSSNDLGTIEERLADLAAQTAKLERDRDMQALPAYEAVHGVLTAGKAATLAQDLTAWLDQLPPSSLVRVQVGNVITVMSVVPDLVAGEIKRINDQAVE